MATVDALVRCLETAGGTLRCGQSITRVEVRDGRAVAVHARGGAHRSGQGGRLRGRRRRLLLGLLDEANVPPRLLAEARRIHVGGPTFPS
jgi:phytoene dehydrogenase-like protein